MSAKVLTGNRLWDGAVIYLAADGTWSERLAEARLVDTEADEATLVDAGERAVQARLVVGPYLMEALASPAGPQPTRLREVIRATGPTIAIGPGKQSQSR